MSDRPSTTKALSDLVARRLTARNYYWAAEVNLEKNTDHNHRIDFVGFKPGTDGVVRPYSVEAGNFVCFEVKSSMADYKSGHGLTFVGDENYLVCTHELADELKATNAVMPSNLTAVLCPTKSWSVLRTNDWPKPKATRRRRVASELLWAICQSHDLRRAGVYKYSEVAKHGNQD